MENNPCKECIVQVMCQESCYQIYDFVNSIAYRAYYSHTYLATGFRTGELIIEENWIIRKVDNLKVLNIPEALYGQSM